MLHGGCPIHLLAPLQGGPHLHPCLPPRLLAAAAAPVQQYSSKHPCSTRSASAATARHANSEIELSTHYSLSAHGAERKLQLASSLTHLHTGSCNCFLFQAGMPQGITPWPPFRAKYLEVPSSPSCTVATKSRHSHMDILQRRIWTQLPATRPIRRHSLRSFPRSPRRRSCLSRVAKWRP